MPKSAAYERIKTGILRIVATIPEGRVATFGDIGRHLDVMPRHVAYILTTLSDDEKARFPWHRVVAEKGKLGKPKFNGFGISQAELLASEGIEVTDQGMIADFGARLVLPSDGTSTAPD